MTLKDAASGRQPLRSIREQTIALTRTPEVDVLVAELLFEELGELEEAVGVGEQVVKAALPGGHAAADRLLALFLLALEGEAVQALPVTSPASSAQLLVFLLEKTR